MRKLAAIVILLGCIGSAWAGFVFTPPALQGIGGSGAVPSLGFYVDASAGNDANAGTQAHPWQTLHKVNNTVFAFGSTVNLQGSFSGGDHGLIFTTSNAPTGGVTIQSYGAGATITSGNSTACVSINAIPTMQVLNLTCVGGSDTVSTTDGIAIFNFTVNSRLVGSTVSGNTISGYGCIGISMRSFGGASSGYSSPTVTNNTIHDVGGQAACSVTAGIWLDAQGNPSQTQNTNVTVTGNTIFNIIGAAASFQNGVGMTIAESTTGLVANNLVHDNGASAQGCPASTGILIYAATAFTVQFNEVYNTKKNTGCDGEGIDLDTGVTNSVVQYNYSHNNDSTGLAVFSQTGLGTWDNNIFRYNITENNGSVAGCEFNVGLTSASVTNIQVSNNTFVANADQAVCDSGSGGTWGGIVENNIIDSTGGAQNITVNLPGSLTFDHNNYPGAGTNFRWNGVSYTTFATYIAGASQDTHSNISSASFSGTPFAGTCGTAPPQPCPARYSINAVSAQLGVGVSIASPGSRDYYGNAIPNGVGTGYNIGAYGGVGTTSFDPGNKGTGIVLSNNNLTGASTNIGSDTYGIARSTASHSTGKFYMELTINIATAGLTTMGICNSSLSLNAGGGGSYPGQDAAGNSLGQFSNGNNWLIKNVNVGTSAPGTTTNNDRYDIAIDLTNSLGWNRLNNGNWNNSGAANPATGTGGVSISTMATGPYFLCVGLYQDNTPVAQATANFGASAYTDTPPSGFGNW